MKKQYQFMATATAAVLTASVVAVPTTEAAQVFPDVPTTHGHFDTINELAERNIVQGFPDGTFKPGQAVTRGQAAKMIAGILGLDTVNVENPNFKDIKTSFQYYGAIAALVDEGIINGYEDGTYRPDATLTRGHMAKILTRAFKLEQDENVAPFTDIALSEYRNDIEALYDHGVTVGTTATTYSPRENVTRAQLASFIIRAEDAVEFELVEVTGTITKIENGVVTIAGVEYASDSQWAAFFGEANEAALLGADIVLTVQKSKTGNVIKNVKSLKLKAANTTFDAQGLAIEAIEIAANGVTLKNADAKDVKIADKVKATITDSDIDKITLGVDANAAFSGTNSVGGITVPKGVKPADVITGLPNVSDIPVTEYEPTTPPVVNPPVVNPPSTGGGGNSGGGGGTTPPTNYEPGFESLLTKVEGTEQFQAYKAQLQAHVDDILYDYATTGGGTITIDVADDATLQQLRAALATEAQEGLGLVAFAQEALVGMTSPQSLALDALSTITVTVDDVTKIITIPTNKLSNEALATLANNVKVAAVEAYNELGGDTLVKDLQPASIKVVFSNDTTLTYNVNVQ
ncbi:MAG: S-layer homology domain-containing protein [Caryophanon sp.]|nr:S-layer homology domain-containing protein [Caryophanon sp.]